MADDFSIIALVNSNNTSLNYQGIFSKNTGSNQNYGLYLMTDEITFQFYNSGWYSHTTTTEDLVENTSYLISMVFDVQNGLVKLYKDDSEVLSETETGTMLVNSHPAKIGTDGAEFFSGMIDEINVLSKVVTPAWIKATTHSHHDDLISYSYVVDYTPPPAIDSGDLIVDAQGGG